MVSYFPPCPDKAESKQRAKRPPHHSGLKISPVTTLRATRSLRSLRQALRLTPPAKFSPFGHRPPFKGAGSCTSAALDSSIALLSAEASKIYTLPQITHPGPGVPASTGIFCIDEEGRT